MEAKEPQEEQKQRYLDGLKKYRQRGIPIYIDGKEAADKDWEKIFELCEDGSFYMGDYVSAETGSLKEIRFDKVYYK